MGAKYLYSSILLACLGCFVSATVMGWSSPMVEKLKNIDDNPLGRSITPTEDSWLASLSILGTCVGCAVISIVGSKFGRKTLMYIQGFIILVFYLIMAWAKTIWLLFLGRFMTGFGVGGMLSVLPLYIGELSEAKNRGIFTTAGMIFMNAGMLLSYAAGPYCTFFTFHLMLAAIAATFSVLFFIFALESPNYVIIYDRYKAEEILRKLRGNQYFHQHLDEMEESSRDVSKESFMEVFSSKASIKALIIGIGGFSFSQLTGTTVISSYTQTILKEAGGILDPKDGPIVIHIVQLITSVFVSVIADTFPRRSLLVFSHLGISLSEIPLGVYFYLKFNNYGGLEYVSWLPLICLIVYSVTYSFGVGPIYGTFLSELFAPRIKKVVISFLVVYNYSFCFLITLLYNNLEEAIGLDYLLLISAGFGFLAIMFIRLYIIETQGKTLQEIQEELSSSRHL